MLFTNEARMSLEHFCWLLAIGYEARLTGQGSQNGLDVPKPRVTTLLFTGFSGGFTWSRGYEYGYSVGKWGCRFRMNCPGCPHRTPWELSPSGSQLCMDIQVGQTFLGPLYGTILKTVGHPTHWALVSSRTTTARPWTHIPLSQWNFSFLTWLTQPFLT